MAGGRPRTTTFPKDIVISLGEKLVKWASEESTELRSRFCEWYTLPEIDLIRNEWEALIKLEEFRVYYERARALLGRKFIDGTINPSIGHRLMWHYVPESAEQEKERITFEYEQKRKSELTVPPNDNKIDSENQDMTEKHQMRQRIKELEEKLDNFTKARPELLRSDASL